MAKNPPTIITLKLFSLLFAFSPLVENLWKTKRKTLRKSIVKLCGNTPHAHFPRGLKHFFTDFSRLSHWLLRKSPTPVIHPTFPLFHQASDYNYNNLINNK